MIKWGFKINNIREKIKMNNKELVIKLADLQIELVEYVEKHTNLRCLTQRDFHRILTNNKLTCTYGLATKNLYNNVVEFASSNLELLNEVEKLKSEVENSSIKDLRFGFPQKNITEEERELHTLMLRHQLKYIIERSS